MSSGPAAAREALARRLRWWRRVPVASVLIWLLVLPGAAWAVVRLFGLERGPLVQLLAFTPYVAAAALLPLAVTLLTRRWLAAGMAGLTVLLLAAAVLPRALPAGTGPEGEAGPVVRVLTANLRIGGADPSDVADLVRDHDVDLLVLQELTATARHRLHRTGLGRELPHHRADPREGPGGSAVYSRFPLRDDGVRVNVGRFVQSYATVQVPGAAPVVVESVHTCAPFAMSQLRCWRADLADQPPATPEGPVRVLAGDFNATLDHAAMRRLVGTGYRDAAAAVGAGLRPTWGPYGGRLVPPVTLDRVLVDERAGVREVAVHPLSGSDHRALLAELVLPAADQT